MRGLGGLVRTDEYMRATELRPSLSMPCQSRLPVLHDAKPQKVSMRN